MDITKIPSPCYVLEEQLLRNNLKLIKEVKDKADATGEQIRAEIDKVMQAIHPISQKMYEQAQAEAQAQQGAEQQSQAGDDVVDADYEVVDEDK